MLFCAPPDDSVPCMAQVAEKGHQGTAHEGSPGADLCRILLQAAHSSASKPRAEGGDEDLKFACRALVFVCFWLLQTLPHSRGGTDKVGELIKR